jgi:hypothetical protein
LLGALREGDSPTSRPLDLPSALVLPSLLYTRREEAL